MSMYLLTCITGRQFATGSFLNGAAFSVCVCAIFRDCERINPRIPTPAPKPETDMYEGGTNASYTYLALGFGLRRGLVWDFHTAALEQHLYFFYFWIVDPDHKTG